jgi:cell fate regulator YaaT (PSP1 superfamily)
VYKELAKSLPKMGQKIVTDEGKGRVISVNVLKKYVHVDYGEGKVMKHDYTNPQSQTGKPVNVEAER